ncbi:Hint domain-containing protein, partial [Mameliella sp. CS4]|uniref:Hint domain-containing protein n=1 Tax=Mameliella sp. CS4 TaxID=2862329 RepID=UPI001C5F8B83
MQRVCANLATAFPGSATMATINGGSGDNTLNGTSGNDTIVGGEGADAIDAGAGDDIVHGDDAFGSADGGDTIDAGDGADTVYGADGDDVIQGGAGADSLHGAEGNDIVDGGDGNDTLYGDQGNDTLDGGGADDLIYGGDGDDEIRGGAGNDTIYGHAGADSFVITTGSENDVIEDYNAGDGDILVIDYPGITTYAELEPYLSDDGNWGTLISLPDGSVTQVKWLNYGSQSASDFSFQSGPLCFLKGTLIDTATGPRPVETLRPGDMVETLDSGMKPIRFISCRRYKLRVSGLLCMTDPVHASRKGSMNDHL